MVAAVQAAVRGAPASWPSTINAQHISKRYGERLAVDDLTFTVQPGVVTGFLGPNGAGGWATRG